MVPRLCSDLSFSPSFRDTSPERVPLPPTCALRPTRQPCLTDPTPCKRWYSCGQHTQTLGQALVSGAASVIEWYVGSAALICVRFCALSTLKCRHLLEIRGCEDRLGDFVDCSDASQRIVFYFSCSHEPYTLLLLPCS